MFAEFLAWDKGRPTFLLALVLAVLTVGVGLFAGGVYADAGSPDGTDQPVVSENRLDTPQITDSFIFLQPGAAGNCPAPPNGGTTDVGCRFVLDLMVNAGTNAAPDGLIGEQSYLTYTYQTIQNTRVSIIGTSCSITRTITADRSVFDAELQNEICTGPAQCNFRGHLVDPGSFAYASAALNNCGGGTTGCPDPSLPPPQNQQIFRVAQIGICVVAAGQATLHWRFNNDTPPNDRCGNGSPSTRDTELVLPNGDLAQDCTLFTDYTFCIGGSCPTSTPTLTPCATCPTDTPTVTNTPTITNTPTPTFTPNNALLFLRPGTTVSSCSAPANGGTTLVGCRFVLDLMVNAGSNAAPDGIIEQKSYITFTNQTIQNAKVVSITTSCVLTNSVTPDLSVFDAGLQNEVCNTQTPCVFRGVVVDPGSLAFASGALSNCPSGCPDPSQPPPQNQQIFRVAEIGICAVSPGQATLSWQFADTPPNNRCANGAPSARDTEIWTFSGRLSQDCTVFTTYSFTVSTPTLTPTLTPCPSCPSHTPSPTSTKTPTNTRTRTFTNTPTITNTRTPTLIPSNTATSTPNCGPTGYYVIDQTMGATIEPGTSLIGGSQCDDCIANITLPFTYSLYGQPYTNVNASSNGNLQFTTSNEVYDNTCLYAPVLGSAIMAYWDDLLTNQTSNQGIYTSVTGLAPNRIFNIEWRASYVSTGGAANLEVRLYEGQAKFDLVYGQVDESGRGATVGVQRGTPPGNVTQFECNISNSLTQGLQLMFYQPSCTTSTPTSTSTSTPTRTGTNTVTNTSTYTVTNTPTNTATQTHTPTSVPVLVGHVTWQGRPAQPSVLQQLLITLTLKMGTTEVNYSSQNTDASGLFTVTLGSLAPGTYNWRAKGPKYLANSGQLLITGAATSSAEMGLLRAGDANNDNVVSTLDFNILRNTFGKSVGQPGYDDRADFNGDQVVNTSDFNLLRGNYGLGGSPPVGPRAP